MKKIITICLLMATTFTVLAQDNKTYYYYAYGTETGVLDKVYITPLQTITINEKTHFSIVNAGVANQFRDYMEAEYSNLNGRFFPDGEVYYKGYFDEATATSYYRSTLKRYDSFVKILYFEYLPERKD
jgi:hypothetical protein